MVNNLRSFERSELERNLHFPSVKFFLSLLHRGNDIA